MKTLPRAVAVALTVSLAVVAAPALAGVNVAVLYFDNNTGDAKYDALNKGLADMIITDLSAVEGLTLVERSRLQDVVAEQKLQRTKMFDPKTSVKVAKLLGARYAVTGAIAAIDPTMRLDIRLIDVQSGAVVVADKVTGAADQFFDLQTQLVTRFAKGLNKAVPSTRAKATSGAPKLGNVLDYAQSLDLADKGNLKGASQKLAKLVSAVPQFQLAKTRYEAILKRLYASKSKRDNLLDQAAQGLLDICQKILDQGTARKKGRKLKTHLAYRVLRGNIVLGYLAKLIGAKNNIFAVTPDPAKRPQAEELAHEWSANQGALVAELIAARRMGLSSWMKLQGKAAREHVKAAEELGAGIHPDRQPFMTVHTATITHAKFLCTGKSAFASSVKLAISPSPAAMRAGNGWYAKTLFQFAIDDMANVEPATFREREHIRALDAYADCLMALEQKTDALAKWQSILDTYPKASAFPRIEKKMKRALGIK